MALGSFLVLFGLVVPIVREADAAGLTTSTERSVAIRVDAMINKTRAPGVLPYAENKNKWFVRVPVTAYSSEVGQTDSTPFITASGSHVRDGVVAANFLPIGTRVRIPEIDEKKVFIVEDRMNARYDKHLDIWMADTKEAKKFGRKTLTIEVL